MKLSNGSSRDRFDIDIEAKPGGSAHLRLFEHSKDFITEPAREPEQPIRIADVTPGREMTYLRWHPNGSLLLLILDGDVYSLVVPERYRDMP